MAQERSKLLLIEHDSRFARFAGEMLGQARDLTVDISAAGDLWSGLEALTRTEFDLVLMDLAIPEGAGLGNLPLLKAVAPRIPVILCGESEDETLALEAAQSGAHDYLVKGQLTSSWLERSIRYAIERHEMDKALLQAEEKYHNLFDSLVEGIFQTTPDGHYLMANAALARIYGYASPEDLIHTLTNIGRSLYVDPGRRDEFVRQMQEKDTLAGFESRVFRKDGSIIWISENCRAIRDAQGQLRYYEGTVEDITQRREAEERLLHSEALYHSLVETLPQNIFRKNLQGEFTFANQQFCKTLNRPLEEIVGKTDYDFFPPDLAAKYQKDDRRVMATGQPYDTVEEHQPPGRGKIFVQVVKTPLVDPNGQTIGIQAIFWDITEQREAEAKLKRANSELARSRKELRAKNQQMEEDLKMAREIQQTILPQQYPLFPRSGPDSESAFKFTHRYLPTGSVGGDFFTVSALSETLAGVFLCDVAGHGVRSALVTAMIRAIVEELKPVATDPGKFLTKLNQDLCAILKHTGTPVLTTAFYLVADSQSGTMRFANAGHPKPLHLRVSAGQLSPLGASNNKNQPALGLFETAVYRASEVQLANSDIVMLFTDGLVEVHNAQDQLYDEAMLIEGVARGLQLPMSDLIDQILDEVRRFSGSTAFPDDVCVLGMQFGRAEHSGRQEAGTI